MSSRWLISLLGFKSLDPFDPLKYSPFPERLDSSIYPLSRSIRSRYMLVFRGIAIRSRKTLEWLNLIRLSSSITRFGDLARVLLFRVSNLRHLLWPFLIKKYHLNYRFRFESRVVLRLKSSKFSRLTKSENRIGDDKLVYVIRFWTIPIWFSTRCFVCKIIMSFLSMSMKVCHLLEVLEVWYDRNSKVYCALIRDFLWARLQDISSQTLFLWWIDCRSYNWLKPACYPTQVTMGLSYWSLFLLEPPGTSFWNLSPFWLLVGCCTQGALVNINVESMNSPTMVYLLENPFWLYLGQKSLPRSHRWSITRSSDSVWKYRRWHCLIHISLSWIYVCESRPLLAFMVPCLYFSSFLRFKYSKNCSSVLYVLWFTAEKIYNYIS